MPAGYTPQDFVFLLPEIVLTAGALLVLAVDVLLARRHEGVVLGLALAVLAATGAALVPTVGANVTVAAGLVAVDGFARFFKVVFLLAAAVTILMSSRYLAIEGVRAGEYAFLVLCATLGMMIMAGGVDLVTIFIGLETMAVSFYVLTGFIKPNRRSNEAAVKYFLLGAFSLGILLYGLSLLYGLTGTTHLRDLPGQPGLATALAAAPPGVLLPLAVVLVAAGVGFKIAAVPFHMWAPDVYEGAPTPVTAFLSVGSKAASFAMLLRIFVEGLPQFRLEGVSVVFGQAMGWSALFYVLSVVSMTVGNLAAITQSNVKRLLAYSSIAHAGYVLIGVVAGSTRGVAAALIYLFVYLFMQLGAFATVVLLRRRDVIGDELKDLSGLYFRSPAAAIAMLVFMLSLGGIPPTAGFMGKFWLFSAAIESGYVWLAVIGVLNSAVSLYYYVRVIVFMWVREQTLGSPLVPGPALGLALVATAVGTIVFGVYPAPLFEFGEASARTLGTAAAALVGWR
jgi:NADH-quinone oxidoreductase subunit N